MRKLLLVLLLSLAGCTVHYGHREEARPIAGTWAQDAYGRWVFYPNVCPDGRCPRQ